MSTSITAIDLRGHIISGVQAASTHMPESSAASVREISRDQGENAPQLFKMAPTVLQ